MMSERPRSQGAVLLVTAHKHKGRPEARSNNLTSARNTRKLDAKQGRDGLRRSLQQRRSHAAGVAAAMRFTRPGPAAPPKSHSRALQLNMSTTGTRQFDFGLQPVQLFSDRKETNCSLQSLPSRLVISYSPLLERHGGVWCEAIAAVILEYGY